MLELNWPNAQRRVVITTQTPAGVWFAKEVVIKEGVQQQKHTIICQTLDASGRANIAFVRDSIIGEWPAQGLNVCIGRTMINGIRMTLNDAGLFGYDYWEWMNLARSLLVREGIQA